MAKTKYSTHQKAEALATLKANAGNVTLTASLLRIPRKTLSAWSKGSGISQVPEGMVEEKASELADRLDHIANLLTKEMQNPEKIAKADLKTLSIAMGVTIDKRNLLRHQPTSISARVNSEVNHFERMIQHLTAEAKRNGAEITREEAVEALAIYQPNIREFVN